MPIYGINFIKSCKSWCLYKRFSKDDFNDYIIRLIRAKNNFIYSEDQIFLSSIKTNTDYNKGYIASYDINLTRENTETYSTKLECLINYCNRELLNKNFKFDIVGSWTVGRIIIMKCLSRNY